MVSMAVFNGDAFQAAAMIRGIERRTYIPSGLDEIMGFTPTPVNKDVVYIGQKSRTNGVIQTTLRGAPIEMRPRPTENYRPIRIPRIAEGDQLYAHELIDLVPFEGQSDADIVAMRIAEMQEDLIGDVEITEENMRLGALNGIVLDKDGATIVNYYTEFGIVAPSAVDLTLDNASMTIGELRSKIGTLLTIPITQAARTGSASRVMIHAVCGDAFWYALTGHPAVAKTYEGYAAAEALREDRTWSTFEFAGVMWYHYRGTDDGSTIAINTNQARVFPYGLRGMFQHVMGPFQESLAIDLRGQPGRRYYAFLEKDKSEKMQWVQPEIYAYPLFLNSRPDLILTATI